MHVHSGSCSVDMTPHRIVMASRFFLPTCDVEHTCHKIPERSVVSVVSNARCISPGSVDALFHFRDTLSIDSSDNNNKNCSSCRQDGIRCAVMVETHPIVNSDIILPAHPINHFADGVAQTQVTKICGMPDTGQTHLAMQLCVNACLPTPPQDGIEGPTV